MWWLALMLAAVPAEQWADEARVSEAPRVLETLPRFGPVAGIHIGASRGTHAPDLGARLGARFNAARSFGVSLFVDSQWAQQRASDRCAYSRVCAPEYTTTLLSGVARLEFVTDGRVGPFFVPQFTAGIFVGGGVGFLSRYQYRPDAFEPARIEPFARVGLHLGMTRLPGGWWFPFFLDLGTICSSQGCNELNFVAGIGL